MKAFRVSSIRRNKTMNEENSNPQLVLDAIMGDEVKFDRFELKPLTIYRYAVLERLGSPFLSPDRDFTVESITPTIFVLASEKADIKKFGGDMDALREAALDWADDHLEVEDFPKAVAAVTDAFLKVNRAAPQAGGQQGDVKKN